MAAKSVKANTMKVVDYFAECLESSGIKVSKIVVFGSHAKGTANKNSDIDLIVVSESFKRKSLYKRSEMIGSAYEATVSRFLIPMDIITETP